VEGQNKVQKYFF